LFDALLHGKAVHLEQTACQKNDPCHRLRWYLTLRRIGVTPQFAAVGNGNKPAVHVPTTLHEIDAA
jgi:hypothetical protein